jgi:uncharacterized protein (DUF1501 family)
MSDCWIATRREFLTRGLGLIGVATTVPSFLVRTALAGPDARSGESILVVLQLSGGHDGLSAVIPYGNDDYARNRTATRIKAEEVLKRNDELGLHPGLKGFQELLDQQALAVIQGVGYPNPNRSHFKSMDIWHSGDSSGKPVTSGWIGRYGDCIFPARRDAKLVLAVGSERAPRAIQGKEYVGLSIQRPEAYRYFPDQAAPRLGRAYRKLNQLSVQEAAASSNLEFIARTAVDANASSDAILKLAQQRSGGATYPQSPLANSLRTVASLIAGGLSTRVYYVFQGGYDTHAGQRVRHDRLMTELGEAVRAFQKDLTQQGNSPRVLTMTFSEFGRRVRENGSQGTDHGTAGPMFLFGPGVQAGLHGKHPSLADADLDRGDLRFQVDFRSIYATVLEKWLGTPAEAILGQKYPLLTCVKGGQS